MQTRFQCESTFTLTSPPWTTGRRLGTHAAASATLGQEICARLRLVRFSSVGSAPSSATEPSVQLELSADGPQTSVSDSR